MIVKGIVDEDVSNYHKCSMFIIFPKCSLKCDIENQCSYCHNSSLLREPDIEITADDICQRYLGNPISHALVIGGLEPFDTPEELLDLVKTFRFRARCLDDIVIYTGYTEEEIQQFPIYESLTLVGNLIIKFGRFRPYQESHFDEILGVSLANDEQYAKRIGVTI